MTEVGRERHGGSRCGTDVPSAQALALLLGGHRHYRAGHRTPARPAPAGGFVAAVLSCAEPQIPADVLFGGLDLFAVRTVGLRIGPAVLGSIEYAVGQLGLPLVVVLGHSRCGVPAGSGAAKVRATANALRHGSRLLDGALTDGRCALVGMHWDDEREQLRRVLPAAAPVRRSPLLRPPPRRLVRAR